MVPPPPPPPMPGPMAGPTTNPHGVHYMEANGGDRFTNPVSHSFIVVMNVINVITQLLLGGVVLAAVLYANTMALVTPKNSTTHLTEHIYLCVFGYMVLMSQAILTFNPHAGWANSLKHPQKTAVHWIMQVVGSILAITGSVMKLVDDDDNFETAHGIIGLVAMCLTFISLISGVLHLVIPTLTKTKLYSTLHGCLGSFTITMAYISLGFAFEKFRVPDLTNADGDDAHDINANVIMTITIGALVGILVSSFTRIFKRWDSD